MAYIKKVWENNKTRLTADNLNAMEAGISKASTDADQALADVADLGTEVDTLKGNLSDLSDTVDTFNTRINAIDSTSGNNAGRIEILETTARTHAEQLGSQKTAIEAFETEVPDHINNKDNPHEVTAEQLNVYTKNQTKSYVSSELQKIISCGTADPDDSTFGTYYFKYIAE